MTISPAGLWQVFAEPSSATHSRDAIVCGDARLTHLELLDRSRAVAASWLARARTDRKMRILILHKDPLDILVSVLAAWSLDSTAAVLRPYGPERVPRVYLDTIAPDLIVTGDGVLAADGPPVPQARRVAEECLILATSGTISEPKLVAVPLRCVDLTTLTIARDLGLAALDRVQVASPLTYFYGLVGGALMALRQRATIFLYAPPFVPGDLHGAIRSHQITVVQGTPSFHRMGFQFWNGRPFESVRVMTEGGESCGPALAAQLASAYPVAKHVQVYGMTEGGRISHRVIGEPALASNEIGAPFPHIEWKIVPIDKDGSSDMDMGRLAIRGPSVMLGYVDASRGYWGLDDEGYFLTNDLVTLAPGGLRFLGRYDRCFKTGGKFVNPAVVESLLMSQGDVYNAVCSAKHHDILGQVPSVKVIFARGAEMNVERLRALCARELEPHIVPREIVTVSDLPQGSGGKTSLRAEP